MGYHYDPILCMNVPDSTSKAKDAKPLSKMDMNELRALYVSLGGDIKRTYGTSKQAMILKIDDLKRKGKDVPQSSLDKVVGYREISMETRRAKVGDVEVYMGDTGSEIVDFTVNWPSIGYVSPDKALSFARDLMKAASNAKKLEQKYKGYKIKF